MLLHNSQKLHPEFDLLDASQVYASAGFDTNLSGEHITSPFDLFSVEALRDRLNLRKRMESRSDSLRNSILLIRRISFARYPARYYFFS